MDFLKIRRKAKERSARADRAVASAPPAEAKQAPRPRRRPASRPAPVAEAAPGDRAEAGPEPARPPRPVRALPGSPEALRLEAEMGSRVAALPFAPDARFVTWRPDGGGSPAMAAIAPIEVAPAPAAPDPAWPPVPLTPLDEFFYRGDEVAPGLVAPPLAGGEALAPVTLEEYLVVLLGGQSYAVEIGRVLEVMRTPPITEVPRAPPDVLGVISVRGDIITVVDPRSRLGLGRPEGRAARRVVIVDDGDGACGLLVDGVAGVVRLPTGTLEPCPQALGNAGHEHFLGIGRDQERIFLVLDLRALLRPLRRAAEARPR